MPKDLLILPRVNLNIWKKPPKSLGAKGLAFIKSEGGEWKSPILKFLSDAEQETLKTKLEVGDGDIVFFAAGSWDSSCNILGRVRLEAATLLEKRGQSLRDPKGLEISLGDRFPTYALRRGGRSICRLPPPVHRTGGGRFALTRIRTKKSSRSTL